MYRVGINTKTAMRSCNDLEINRPQLERALVRYDKDEYIGQLSAAEIDTLGWSQKPAVYADEYEYRYRFLVIPELLGSPEHYHISIGKKLEYCELVTRMLV